jgi:hypothetical protein
MRMPRFCRFHGATGKSAGRARFAYCALPRGAASSGSAADKKGRDEYP